MDEKFNENNNEVFITDGIESGLEEMDISANVKSGFLDYAMSVIVARALPDARDGFKPVQRRIIYSMDKSGYVSDKPHVKCAKIVGDVMGYYHPHGDSSIYETLVRMAQDFSMSQTLIDGHGNFGNIDGDGAAAYRYTEARLAKVSNYMIGTINENTVNFIDNYDGSVKEPEVLPVRFPNLLVNGSSGIAVGMATNIPPHNIDEVLDGLIAYAKNPNISIVELMDDYIHGPDFPTGGTILGRSGIKKAYETGRGKVVCRGKATIEKLKNGKSEIIISEIPYQVNKAELVKKIASLADSKEITGITDVKDETSYKTGIKVIVELSKDIVPEVVLNQLYKKTELQSNFNANIIALVNGEPKLMGLLDIYEVYLDFQISVIKRRSEFRLAKAKARDNILIGLLIAHDNIDEVIKIIKTDDNPALALKERFELNDAQVEAVLSMPLRRLGKLETEKIVQERNEIEKNIEELEYILESREHLIEVVIKEAEEVKQKINTKRRSLITNEEVDIEDEDLITEEEIVITLTTGGYIKRLTTDTFKTQNRGGKGVKGMTTNNDDIVDRVVKAKTHTDILFFTNFGKVYRLRGHQIPEGSRISKGIPVGNFINLDENEKVLNILPIDEYKEGNYLFIATKKGICKRTKVEEFKNIRQNGKIAISLKEGDELLGVKETNGTAYICIAADNGKMVKFHENEVRIMGRTASGVRGIKLESNDTAIALATSLDGEYVLSLAEKGYGKMSDLESYRLTSRGAKGVITLAQKEKNGRLVALKVVSQEEDALIITKEGTVIRIPLSQVSVVGRNALGVKIINLKEDERIASLAIIPHEEEVIEDNEDEEIIEDVVE